MNRGARLFLFAACVLLVTALSTGGRAYYLFAIMMLLMLALGLLTALLTLLLLKVEVSNNAGRVSRGTMAQLVIRVRSRFLLPTGAIRFVFAPKKIQPAAMTLAPFKTKELRVRVPCPHRGVDQVGVESVSVSDVFGLFCLRRKIRGVAIVEVLPNPLEIAPLAIPPGEIGPEFKSRATDDPASPSGVREWRDGDALKNVHWKLTMRRMELTVRTYEESARPDTLILPDLTPIQMEDEARLCLEDRICETALGAAKAQLQSGLPVAMPLCAKEPSEPSALALTGLAVFREALMRVRFDSPYAFEQAIALQMRRCARTGGLILVAERPTSRVADAAIRMRRLGVSVKLLCAAENARSSDEGLLAFLIANGVAAEFVDSKRPSNEEVS